MRLVLQILIYLFNNLRLRLLELFGVRSSPLDPDRHQQSLGNTSDRRGKQRPPYAKKLRASNQSYNRDYRMQPYSIADDARSDNIAFQNMDSRKIDQHTHGNQPAMS